MIRLLILILSLVLFNSWPSVIQASEKILGWKTAQLDRLPPAERERIRKNYEEYKKLSPEEKNHLMQKYEKFQQAPPEEKNRLKENYRRFEKMTPEERKNLEDYLRNKGAR